MTPSNSPAPLLPWPKEKPEHLGLANSAYWERYERAMKEAAMQRLRVAVEALQGLSLGEERWTADEALAAIGSLPTLPPLPDLPPHPGEGE